MSQKLSDAPSKAYTFKNALLAGCAAIVLNGTAQAQDAKKDEEKAIMLAPISIDAKADVITGGVQVDADDLERIDPVDMKDVFRQEPGVHVGAPVSIAQKVYVNGIEDTNLAVDIDGARQANKTYHHIGTTIMDPGLLKSIKVETGVAPADAGPAALGGSMSVETKDGRDLVTPGENFGGFGKIAYNTNTKGFSEDLALGARYDNVDVLFYGSNAGGQAYKDGDGNKVKGTSPEAYNALFKIGATGSTGYRLKFSANYMEDDGIRSARPNFVVATQLPSHTMYDRTNVTLAFGDETPSDMWDPKASLSYTKADLTDHRQNSITIVAHVETLNGKLSNTFTTDMGKITTGVDFYNDKGTGGYNAPSFYTEENLNIGGFAQARLDLTDRLRSSIGGRYDFARLEGNDGTKVTDSGLSANANIEYDITSQVMGYGGLSTVFGGLPIAEAGTQTNVSRYNDIESARARNYKIGAAYEIDQFSVDGNWFWTEINNAPILGDPSFRHTHHDINSRGFNISGKYNYGDGFVKAGFSRSTVRVDSDIPSTTADSYTGTLMGDMMNLEVTHTLPEYGVRLGTTNEYAFSNDDIRVQTGKSLPSYLVSNVYGEWMPEDVNGLTLRLDVKNLFDATYADRANAAYDHAAAFVYELNDPGRSVILTAKLDF